MNFVFDTILILYLISSVFLGIVFINDDIEGVGAVFTAFCPVLNTIVLFKYIKKKVDKKKFIEEVKKIFRQYD